MKVLTTDGLVERSDLIVRDVVSEEGTTRTIASEWFLGDKMVKRSVWVDVLAPLEVTINGGG